jgi:hypothetical protein
MEIAEFMIYSNDDNSAESLPIDKTFLDSEPADKS